MAAPDEPTAPAPPSSEEPTPALEEQGIQEEQPAVSEAPPPVPALTPEESFALWRQRMDVVLVALVLLLAFELGLFPARNPDLLMNRAVGRLVAHGDYDFYSDPFTYTTEGVRWVNHSWLFGVLAYGMHQVGNSLGNAEWGDSALIVLKALLLAALAECMLRVARRPGRSLWVPALCTGLALLSVSTRVFLQPVCISYLFLGLTVYLLDQPRRRQAAATPGTPVPFWNARWLLPLICVLWVNLDAWFLLGPAVIALYLVGQLLEGTPEAKSSLSNLAAVLGASVLACLLNPYHIHAFRLPDQLGFSPAGHELQTIFSAFFITPLQNNYFDASIHRSLAGLIYYPLVFLGFLSFVLVPQAALTWRGTVWFGLLLLSAIHARAIPFFAIVAGPITSLNLLDPLVRAYVDIPTDPDRRRRLLSARVLTLLLGVAAFTAGSAGWLHTPIWGIDSAPDSRRPGWWTEFDNSMAKAARQVGTWRDEKRVAENAHWFNTSQDASSFVAWYAPGARVCIDSRLSLYSQQTARQYLQARQLLYPQAAPQPATSEPPAAEPVWHEVFKDQPVGYLLVGEGDLSRRIPTLIPSLMKRSDEWTMCFLYGSASVFGWNGVPAGAAAYAPIHYDSAWLAFGPDADPAPSKRPTTVTEPPQWWEIIWQPEPRRSADASDAGMHVRAFEVQADRKFKQGVYEQYLQTILSSGMPYGPLLNGTAGSQVLFESGLLRDPGTPGDLYLAVRAARRAVANNPEDGQAWYWLGLAYTLLENQTRERLIGIAFEPIREFRKIQKIVALTRAVRLNPGLDEAHGFLALSYQNSGFLDLVLRHREAQFKIARAQSESGVMTDVTRDRLQSFQGELTRLQEERKTRADQYELDSANKSPFQRAQLALRYGLAEEAMKALRDHIRQLNDGSADERSKAPGLVLAVRLLMITGEVDEARLLVQEGGREVLAQSQDRTLPVLPDSAADWYRVLIDAAAGDYADADETLKDLIARTTLVPLGREPTIANASVMVAAGLGDQLLLNAAQAGQVTGIPGRLLHLIKQGNAAPPDGVLTFQQAVQNCFARLGRAADLQTLRGWLALEAGDIETSKSELKDVTTRARDPYAMLAAYRSRPLADMLMAWISKNDHR
jgi:tetratricopeptide (TPR) repeat protein